MDRSCCYNIYVMVYLNLFFGLYIIFCLKNIKKNLVLVSLDVDNIYLFF